MLVHFVTMCFFLTYTFLHIRCIHTLDTRYLKHMTYIVPRCYHKEHVILQTFLSDLVAGTFGMSPQSELLQHLLCRPLVVFTPLVIHLLK